MAATDAARRQDHAIYLDPDIQVLGPLHEVRELAVEHGIVLTPHNITPIPRDGLYPSEESILIAGAYNLGFIAVGNTTAAQELLDWWSERLETDCVVDPASGRFVDQKWIDLVPGLWPSTHLLRTRHTTSPTGTSTRARSSTTITLATTIAGGRSVPALQRLWP